MAIQGTSGKIEHFCEYCGASVRPDCTLCNRAAYDRQAAIQEAASTFPETFRLRGFPEHVFRINVRQSFVGGDGQVSLVVDIQTPDGWRNFSRDNARAIRREIL